MSRAQRVDVAKNYYHVINRANARMTIFEKDADYLTFEKTLIDAQVKVPIDIISYVLMPNHFHFLLHSKKDGDISRFMHFLTMTHTQRWHVAHQTTGAGHIYQGRYKSFLIQKDEHLKTVMRYIERNPLRAKLIKKVEDWKWSSCWRRTFGTDIQQKILTAPPIDLPKKYLSFINESLTAGELETVRRSVNRGSPFGSERWCDKMVEVFKIESTMRSRGRPKKGS